MPGSRDFRDPQPGPSGISTPTRWVVIRDLDGHFRTDCDVPRDRLWESVQTLVGTCVDSRHDSTLVSIERLDKGAAYNAPGEFEVATRDGQIFRVEVKA